MKKILKTLTALLLVVISVFCVSCNKQEEKPKFSTTLNPVETTGEYIVRGGVSEYEILLSTHYTQEEYFAASELQSFIEQTTGVYLPFCLDMVSGLDEDKFISVGNTKLFEALEEKPSFATAKQDSFCILTQGKNLIINGQNGRGTIFGVYEFVESILGVRFLTSDYTYVPQLGTVALYKLSAFIQPTFETRGFLSTDIYNRNPLFALRLRLVNEFNDMPAEYGGNFGWYDGVGQVHSSLDYVSEDIYGKDSEMFYVKDGTVRDICYTNGIAEDGSIDESMEVSAIKVAIESLKGFVLDSSEDTVYFNFAQMDVTDCCSCNRCQADAAKYKRSGILVRFVNNLVREVNQWAKKELNGRQIKVVTFAYLYTSNAPVQSNGDGSYRPIDDSVVCDDNVVVRIAPIYANNYYTFDDERQTADARAMFAEWPTVAKHFFVWTYGTYYPGYFYYYPILHTYQENLAIMEKIGVEYMFIQAAHTEIHTWQTRLNLYVVSKLLWNRTADISKLVDEFIFLYFGEDCYLEISALIKSMDEHVFNVLSNKSMKYDCISDTELYLYENQPLNMIQKQLEILDGCIEKLQKSASENAQLYVERIQEIKLTPLFTILMNGDYYFSADRELKSEYVKDFFNLCDELGVVQYSEQKLISALKAEYAQYL